MQQADAQTGVTGRGAPPERRAGFQERSARLAFLMPALILILLLSIFPLIFSFVLAFLSWDLSRLEGGAYFIGLDNFITLVNDARFWNTARVSLVFVVGAVTLEYVLGLGVAMLLNQQIRFRRFFLVAFLLPMMLTPAAVAYAGRMLFNEGVGPINDIIQFLGGPQIPWFSSRLLALPSLMLLDTWEWTPFMMIILFAGLQSRPPEVDEAARVDGANSWQRFRSITIPSLRPVIIVTTMLSTIWTFNDFVMPFIVTRTGPNDATNIFGTYTYQIGFIGSRLGYAISATAIMIPFLFLFITVLSRLMWREE